MNEPKTAAGRALLGELAESPLPGARYAHDVVSRRLPGIEAECLAQGVTGTKHGEATAARAEAPRLTVDQLAKALIAVNDLDIGLPDGWWRALAADALAALAPDAP